MLDNSNTCGSISTAHARIIPAQLKFRASAENSSAMCFPLLFRPWRRSFRETPLGILTQPPASFTFLKASQISFAQFGSVPTIPLNISLQAVLCGWSMRKSMPTVDSSAMDSSLPHKSSMPPVFTRPFGFPMDEVRAVFIRLTDVPPLKPFYAFRLISKTSVQNLRRFAATPSPAYCAPTTAPTSVRHRDRVFLPPLTDASRALPMKHEATGTTCRSTTASIALRFTHTCAVLRRAFARALSSRKAMRSVMSA